MTAQQLIDCLSDYSPAAEVLVEVLDGYAPVDAVRLGSTEDSVILTADSIPDVRWG